MNNSNKINSEQELIKFKSLGKNNIKNYSFPKEWLIDSYGDSSNLKKEDIENQKKFEELEYFHELSAVKSDVNNRHYINFKEKDNLLKFSKIDSLFTVDSINIGNNRKILTFKTFATIDDKNYEFPLHIFNIDAVLFEGTNTIKFYNIYSEIDYPFYVKKNICNLDTNGNVYCKKFEIEEDKVYYKGFHEENLLKIFNLN